MKKVICFLLAFVLLLSAFPYCVVEADAATENINVDFISNQERRSYVNKQIHAYLSSVPELRSTLQSGKPVVFFFEGASNNLDSMKNYNWSVNRVGAVCVVLRQSGDDINCVWYNQNCSTIPDIPLNYGSKDSEHGPATILDGVYDLYTYNHKQTYATFNVRKNGAASFKALYMSRSGSYDYLNASGINTHTRRDGNAASSNDKSPWSTGCLLIGTTIAEYDEYLRQVNGGVNGTGSLSAKSSDYSSYYFSAIGRFAGKIVVDRGLAEAALKSLYKSSDAVSQILTYSKTIVPSNIPFDINGYLDGVDQTSLANYGTFDVWVNGTLVADNVNDYYAELPQGASYEITDIQASPIHKYLGLREGSLKGTVSAGTNQVRLQFRTNDYIGDDFYAFIMNKNTSRCVYNQVDDNVTGQPMGDHIEEIWHFEWQDNGSYKITSAYNGYTLDVKDYGNTAGTNVQAVPYSGNTAQTWYIFQEDAGYMFSAACTPCVMYEDVNSTNIQMMDDTGNPSQWFSINKIDPAYTFDVNGNINGTEVSTTENYGTFDVWINGQLAADDVVDYVQSLPIGTTYAIKDIKVDRGSSYSGVYYGTLTGRISSAPVWTVLAFSDLLIDQIGPASAEVIQGSHRYVFYPTPVTWYTARQFCEEQGGHLVTITSAEENSLAMFLSGGSSVWTGGSDANNEGAWEWLSGEPFDYTNWTEGEPNNTEGNPEVSENYMVSTANGWNDLPGTEVLPFICEFEDICVHKYIGIVTDPTCTSSGYTTYTCTGCGNSYVDNYTDALTVVAQIGDAQYATVAEALANAKSGDVVTLIADSHEENTNLIIDEGVTLNIGKYDLYARSLNILTGAMISGGEYSQNGDWGKIYLPAASRMVMSGMVVENDGSIGLIPVWDDAASCYVFGGAFFNPSNYIVAVNETAKTLSFKFIPSLRTKLMQGYFQDANEMRDNGLRLVLRLTWPGADENGNINGQAQQDFVYSSEFVKIYMAASGNARFTFLLTGYDTLVTDDALAEMTITPMFIADNGMIFSGETVEIADYITE